MINQILFPGLGLEFSINRVAFQVFGIPIYWYGLLITVGLVLAILYGMKRAKDVALSQDDLVNMVLFSVPVAIIFARIYYVVFSWEQYAGDWTSVFDIRSGGIAIYGAIIGVVLVLITYCKVKKLSLGKVLDVLAIGLLIGQAVGRWGNFVNAEAFGTETALPWGMTIQQGGPVLVQSVHPTFLYESLWNAVGILVLLYGRKFQRFVGEEFCGYLVWYGLGRAWIEGLRADSLYIGTFRVSQILAVATVLVGVAIIIYGRKCGNKNGISMTEETVTTEDLPESEEQPESEE